MTRSPKKISYDFFFDSVLLGITCYVMVVTLKYGLKKSDFDSVNGFNISIDNGSNALK